MTQIEGNSSFPRPPPPLPHCYNYIGLIAWTQGTIHQHNIIIIYTQMGRAYCSLDTYVCVGVCVRADRTDGGWWGVGMDGEATDLCPRVS